MTTNTALTLAWILIGLMLAAAVAILVTVVATNP